MILYIIRHGETDWNKVRRFQGRTDVELNEVGIELAKKTGEGMKDIPIDLVISSPLSRAYKTAQCVIGDRNIPIITDDRIIEISFGVWEGKSTIDGSILSIEEYEKFFSEPLNFQPPENGESFMQAVERTKEFYEEIINNPEYQDKSILISTHGAASRCLLCNFFNDKEDIWRGGVPANCSVSIAKVENGVGELVEMDKIFYS